jgi:hypothetical protein
MNDHASLARRRAMQSMPIDAVAAAGAVAVDGKADRKAS